MKLNRAVIPGTLLETELFGSEKGAFRARWRDGSVELPDARRLEGIARLVIMQGLREQLRVGRKQPNSWASATAQSRDA